MTTDNPYEDGDAIVEHTHEAQRQMALGLVQSARGMAWEMATTRWQPRWI